MGLATSVFWTVWLTLLAVVRAQSTQNTTNISLGDIAALQACNVQDASSSIYQSGLRPEIWYLIQTNEYGAGEVDISAINVTSCLYLAIPIADFLTQVGLSESCNGSAPTVANNTAGRRLLFEDTDIEMLTDGQLSSRGLSGLPGSTLTHRRHLSQSVPSTESLSPTGSVASSEIVATPTGSVNTALPHASGALPENAASPTAAQAPASGTNNACSAAFNAAIPPNPAVSTLKASYSYFAATEIPAGDSEEALVFCLVKYEECMVACLNVPRFQTATDTSLAAMCQLAGLN